MVKGQGATPTLPRKVFMTTALSLSDDFALPEKFALLLHQLSKVTKPKQSRKIESTAAAAQAWAKENDDYDGYLRATELYIRARRRTTELVKPYIQHGGNRKGQGNLDVTLLADFGLTKMQWFRRVKELEIPEELIEEYFFQCREKYWNPSLASFIAFSKHGGSLPPSKSKDTHILLCPNCGAVVEERKSNGQTTPAPGSPIRS